MADEVLTFDQLAEIVVRKGSGLLGVLSYESGRESFVDRTTELTRRVELLGFVAEDKCPAYPRGEIGSQTHREIARSFEACLESAYESLVESGVVDPKEWQFDLSARVLDGTEKGYLAKQLERDRRDSAAFRVEVSGFRQFANFYEFEAGISQAA